MTTAQIELPIPPSVNAMFLNRKPGTRGRGRIPSRKYTEWLTEAAWTVKLASLPRFKGAYSFALLLPEKLRGDVDNRLKPALDLFVKLEITADDRNCSSASVCRRPDITAGRCRVTITGELR